MHRRVSALHADGKQLGDFFGNGEHSRHRLEWTAHEVRIEAADDHALPKVGKFHAGVNDALTQKLRFVHANHFGARRHLRQNIAPSRHQLRRNFEPRVRDDSVLRVALIDYGLEDLHALLPNFRAAQPANQFFALAGKHRPHDHFDPAHVVLDDVHASPPFLCRLTHRASEIQAPALLSPLAYIARLKNGANALMMATRNASCRMIMLQVRIPHAPCASRMPRPPANASMAFDSSTPWSTTICVRSSGRTTAPDWPKAPRPAPSVTYAQLSRKAWRAPFSCAFSRITSMPPSSPIKYFQGSFFSRAI